MDDATKTYIQDHVRLLVLAGRNDRADLTEMVIPEMLEGEGVEDPGAQTWALGMLDTLWQERLAESRTWPRPTDVERLAAVFERLEAQGFVCDGIEGSAVTQGDLFGDLAEIWHDAGGAGSGRSHYLGCHEQDIGGVLEADRGLYLMHGKFSETGGDANIETAQIAADTLKEAGFDVDWDGDPGKRICLRGFVWRKDLPAE